MKAQTLATIAAMFVGATLATTEAHAHIAKSREVCRTSSGLNFRSGPSLHARAKKVLPGGQNITMVGISRNKKWLKVKDNGSGRIGWVYRSYTCKRGQSPNRGGGGVGNVARWRNPVMGTCVTSGFGPRRSPCSGCSSYHRGCDLGAGCGTRIRSAAPGRVIFSGWMGGYGNAVMVRHKNGLVSLYGHMSRRSVSPGKRLAANTTLGRVGTTGASTGCHLHFEVRRGGVAFNPQSLIGGGSCPKFGKSSGSKYVRP